MTRARIKLRDPAAAGSLRVACYTRKSVSEGLEQQFNTLDAQREAVEAYVASQAGEGWIALATRYDDGGFSGATTDRPAFQRLLADVRGGKVDAVAVYRLDRLSRSLLDFAHLMRELDEHGVAFISVTERFDTSTPMGRMVLNLLATFAQFEREMIAQRTSDKVRAARRRGMWTGGRPVLGYDVVEKKLLVNEAEAEQVRAIFALYLDLGSLLQVVEELRLRGITNKRWTTQAGTVTGGAAFTKSTLRSLLRHPLYRGRIRAGDEVLDGEHEAIVEEAAWEAVQARLREKAPRVTTWRVSPSTALLAGIARCSCGAALTPVHTTRKGRRYGYYACSRRIKRGAEACTGGRVAAGELEAFVVERIREVGRDPGLVEAALAADQEERDVERDRLQAEVAEVRTAGAKHVAERDRVVAAVGEADAPDGLVARVRDLDGLVAEAELRADALTRDLAALEVDVDRDALREALAEFDGVWGSLTQAERARVLALLLEAVVYDGATGVVDLRFRCGAPAGHEAAA